MEKESREIEIDLLQLARALWGKAIYIVITTVVIGLLGFVGSKMFITPIYQASTKLIVNTQSGDKGNVSNDRLTSAKSLVDTYAVILRDRDVINQVATELNLSEGYGQLAGAISVKAVNNTQIMQVNVRHTNRETALAIAEKIREIAPPIIDETVGVGSVNPIGQAYVSSNPISPNNLKNGIMAAAVGFVLSCVVILVLVMTDNTYKSDLDIQDDLDLLVLGVIPKIESCKKHAKYGNQYGYGRSTKDKEEGV